MIGFCGGFLLVKYLLCNQVNTSPRAPNISKLLNGIYIFWKLLEIAFPEFRTYIWNAWDLVFVKNYQGSRKKKFLYLSRVGGR